MKPLETSLPEPAPEPTWHSERYLLKPLLLALLSALVVVAGAEFIARKILATIPLAHSYDVPRNPLIDRGWLQFTAPRPRAADEKLIILISNSQGFGREVADPSKIYAARLEQQLNAHAPGQRYIVANWSMNGGIAPDMILLAGRAVAHQPDAVIFATYRNSVLDVRVDYPAYLNNRDLQYIGYEPGVRQLLPQRFLKRFWLSRPRGWLTSGSALLRLHHLFMMPGHAVVLGSVKWPPGTGHSKHEWQPRGEEMLIELHDTLRRGLPETPLILVSMPVALELFTEESRPRVRHYADHLQRLLGHKPHVYVWDAVAAVPAALFCGPTHFWAEGHAYFADWLFARLQPLLTASPPAADAL